MFQASEACPVNPQTMDQNLDSNYLTQKSNFRSFLKNMLYYFIGFVVSTAFVIMIALLFFTFNFSNWFVYGSIIIWSCFNLMNFFLLHYKNLPRERKIFEIFENSCIILIMVRKKIHFHHNIRFFSNSTIIIIPFIKFIVQFPTSRSCV